MIERLPKSVRRTAAIGIGLASLAGIAYEVGPGPENAQAAAPAETAAAPKKIVLEHVEDFSLGKSTVSILRQQGLNIEKTALSKENIERAVHTARQFGLQKPGFDLTIGAPKGTQTIHLPVVLKPNADKFHGYVIAKSPTAVAEIANTATPVPAETIINLGKQAGRVTFLSPTNGNYSLPSWNKKINPDDYDLEVETCNNILEVDLTPKADKAIEQLFGKKPPQNVNTVFLKIGHEAICNSYGLAAAAHDAGLSYAQYKPLAEHNTMTRSAVFDFRVPYVAFSNQQWQELG